MLRLPDLPRVFLDTETTGLDPDKHELIEFAAIKHHPSDDTVEVLEFKIRPENIKTASPVALEVNGYTEEGWSDAISISDALPQIKDFIYGCIVIGHNVSFDLGFIRASFKRHGLGRSLVRSADTLHMAREYLWNKGLPNFKLESVCDYYGVSNAGAHTALADVIRCKEVFDRMYKLLADGPGG